MNKVVKCKKNKCAQYFMRTEKNTKCPFGHTEYSEAEEKTKDLSAQTGKKVAVKTQKKPFKMWR